MWATLPTFKHILREVIPLWCLVASVRTLQQYVGRKWKARISLDSRRSEFLSSEDDPSLIPNQRLAPNVERIQILKEMVYFQAVLACNIECGGEFEAWRFII